MDQLVTDSNSVSPRKAEANRRNAQRSTGPKSVEGKLRSRRNAVKHGVLTSGLLIKEGPNKEKAGEFFKLLCDLQQDLSPEGILEELLLEKIAICYWRQKRVLQCEAGMSAHDSELSLIKNRDIHGPIDPVLFGFPENQILPLSKKLDSLLRYEAAINRQLAYATNQLERLQRTRRGEHLPAPVAVHVSSDE